MPVYPVRDILELILYHLQKRSCSCVCQGAQNWCPALSINIRHLHPGWKSQIAGLNVTCNIREGEENKTSEGPLRLLFPYNLGYEPLLLNTYFTWPGDGLGCRTSIVFPLLSVRKDSIMWILRECHPSSVVSPGSTLPSGTVILQNYYLLSLSSYQNPAVVIEIRSGIHRALWIGLFSAPAVQWELVHLEAGYTEFAIEVTI